jgi:hypothetical protein
MGRLRPHLNTIPLIVRSRGAKNPQISVLFQVPIGSSRVSSTHSTLNMCCAKSGVSFLTCLCP